MAHLEYLFLGSTINLPREALNQASLSLDVSPLRAYRGQVSSSRFSAGARATAVFSLSALLVILLGAAGGLIADPAGVGESCVGCAGCESGECGEDRENPLTSHHHCCTTCCMSHAPFALTTALSIRNGSIARSMPARRSVAVIGRSLEAPYRPPRV
jgi:hypothetical protein